MVFLEDQSSIHGIREELSGDVREMASSNFPVRQSRFHNFTFPTLNWGTQRILRCVNQLSEIGVSDVQTKPEIKRKDSSSPVSPLLISPHVGVSKEKEAVARPWNLRKRRAVCNALSENGKNQHPCPLICNPLLRKDDLRKAVMQRSTEGDNGMRRKFSVSLSRDEIEADFYALKGTKPNRRPKKRPRAVQKQLDALFPGMWLSEVKADAYKVDE